MSFFVKKRLRLGVGKEFQGEVLICLELLHEQKGRVRVRLVHQHVRMSDFCKRKRVRLGLGGGECVCHWNVVVNVCVTRMGL